MAEDIVIKARFEPGNVKPGLKDLSDGLDKVRKQSGAAANSMMNFGRVLQDAPYGFIGIANNLNPLLESFQRLKVESGSTGGAIKSLASSLMGGGGLGLALSAVTAAISFATIGLSAWSRGSAEAAKETAEFDSQLKDVNQTIENTNKAFNSIVAGDGGKLKLFGTYLSNISADKFKNSVTAGNAAFINLSERILDAEKAVKDLEFAWDKAGSALARATVDGADNVKEYQQASDKAFENLQKGNEKVATLYREQAQLQLDNKQLVIEQGRVESELALKRSKEHAEEMRRKGLEFDKIKAIWKQWRMQGMEAPAENVFKLNFSFSEDQTQAIFKGMRPVEIPAVITIDQQASIDKNRAIMLAAQVQASQVAQEISKSFSTAAADVAESFAESLGEALAGEGGGISGLFKKLGNSLATGLKTLGKYLITTYSLMKILDSMKLNPAVGIAAGIAMIALGTLISSKINNQKFFAQGGVVPGTGNRDSVNAMLTPGEFVMTKAAVNRIGLGNLERANAGITAGSNVMPGTQSINGTLTAVIDGKQLRLVLNRADASLSRVG